MQTITRVGYALFFTEENAHEIYLEKARLLSRLRFSLLSYFFSLDFVSPPEFVSASVEYNEATRLSVCIYKGVLFFGFINKVSGLMSFVDKDNTLHAIEPDVFSHLECKMEHAIKSKYNKKEILFERYVTQAWKKITPLLDKIVAFEENIKTLPEDVLHKFKEKLLYDECIDLIIESGTESSPDLDAEIDNRISQAFRIVGEQELKEQSEEQDISSPQISI